jgi:hypothetical protein
MRRLLLLAVGLLTLALAAPTIASAHGRHHGHHKHKHHKAHGAHLSGEAAGTIASFDGATLTIALVNGSTVSGAVTDDTDVQVIQVAPAAAVSHDGDRDDDEGDDDRHWWDHHRRCGSDDGDASDLVAGATVWKAAGRLLAGSPSRARGRAA